MKGLLTPNDGYYALDRSDESSDNVTIKMDGLKSGTFYTFELLQILSFFDEGPGDLIDIYPSLTDQSCSAMTGNK